MRKSESLYKLEELGLNTLNCFITTDKQEAMHYIAKHGEDLLSMRTERGNEFHCPFFYKIPGEQLLDLATKHLKEGYKLIFSPSLDTKGCLAFGTVALGENADDIIEVVFGEGKVRDLDNHKDLRTIVVPKGRMIVVSDKEYPGKAYILNSIFSKLKEVTYDCIPCVIEFSFYDRPVGRLSQNDIYWELREYI